MIIADTDVLIDFLRGFDPVADRIESALAQGLSITAISAFELWDGSVGSKKREKAVSDLIAAMKILPLDAASAKRAAAVRQHLKRKGRTLGMADSLIAGICLEKQAPLLTRNRRHFEDVPGLALGRI